MRKRAAQFAAAALLVAAITWFYFKFFQVNPTTVGFTFLLAVLAVATGCGLSCAVFTSIVSTLAYNFFFLPPVGTFTIADPQNWIALTVFLLTAIIASHLSHRARQEALNANLRRYELERLYSFSQELLATDNILELQNSIPGRVVETFGVTAAAVFLSEHGKTYYSDLAAQSMLDAERIRTTAARGEPTVDPEQGTSYVPLRVGVRSMGGIGVVGASLSRETLDAMGSLVAIAIERAGAVEKLSRTEASRQSESLRTALLDSVTHEFRTPLTAILASARELLSDEQLEDSARRELLSIINEEGERLNRLVGEASEMAQLEAHQVELQMEAYSIADVISEAMEDAARALQSHPVEINVAKELPMARMDPKRIREVVAHLLDNAGKYAPEGTPIHVTSEIRNGRLWTSVADRGPGIEEFEQALIFDKFYRGREHRLVYGTGMGLAIAKAIIDAHGGVVGVKSQVGSGSVFFFSLPLA